MAESKQAAPEVEPVDVTDTVIETLAVEAAKPAVVEPAPAAAPIPVVPSHTPAANLAARDNIVPSGPGSVEDYL